MGDERSALPHDMSLPFPKLPKIPARPLIRPNHSHTDTTNQPIQHPKPAKPSQAMLSFTADLSSFHSICVQKEQQLEAAKRRVKAAKAELEKGQVS